MEETNNVPNGQANSGGMNWKIIIGIVVVIVIVIVVLGMGGNSDNVSDTNTKTSLKNLLAMDGSQKCTVSSKNDTQESSGEIYVTNGMMRGTFTATAGDQTVSSNMIIKDSVSYVWTDKINQGVKMAFSETPTPTDTAEGEQAIDPNQEYDYDCNDWTADASVFELPSDVTFTDLSAMMGNDAVNGSEDSIETQ